MKHYKNEGKSRDHQTADQRNARVRKGHNDPTVDGPGKTAVLVHETSLSKKTVGSSTNDR